MCILLRIIFLLASGKLTFYTVIPFILIESFNSWFTRTQNVNVNYISVNRVRKKAAILWNKFNLYWCWCTSAWGTEKINAMISQIIYFSSFTYLWGGFGILINFTWRTKLPNDMQSIVSFHTFLIDACILSFVCCNCITNTNLLLCLNLLCFNFLFACYMESYINSHFINDLPFF